MLVSGQSQQTKIMYNEVMPNLIITHHSSLKLAHIQYSYDETKKSPFVSPFSFIMYVLSLENSTQTESKLFPLSPCGHHACSRGVQRC